MRTLQCDVDHLHTPAVLRKISIAVARDTSYAAASSSLEDLAELVVSAKQCQRIAIRIGNERLDEQQERIDAYISASIPAQQHGQSDDAPANGWEGRVAVIPCDGGRVQVRDDLWGKDKPEGKKHRWWRETQAGVLQTYQGQPAVDDPTPDVPECLKDPLWVVPKLNEIHAQYRRAGLPITTSPVESTQKQINKRIKGTEKFWRDASLEPLLQLKADDLSETHDREAFWDRRGAKNDGFRHRRRKSKLIES